MTAQPDLPHTWRPLGTRLAGIVLGAMLVILVAAVWIGFGSSIRARFTVLQRGTMVVLGLLALAVWYGLMRCRVTATEAGLVVVNGYRTRAFVWAQLLGVSLRRGAPWATIDVSDGTTISVIAIQSSDGDRAIGAVRALRRLITEHSAPPPL